MDRATDPEKKGSQHNPQHDGWSIHGSVSSFSLEVAIEAMGVKPPSVDDRLLGLPDPLACDRYIQYLLTGVNPSVLNRHKRGLLPLRCRLSTYHSPTFPTDGLHFLPKGPVRSHFNQSTITKRYKEGTNPKSHEWEPPLDFYRNQSSKHSITNVKP
jgi:hypothetical protein